MTVINGALGDDAVILNNKTDVGLYFAEEGLNDATKAKSVMQGVTADPESVTRAKESLNGGNTSSINWLDTEPDGYFSWSEANEWCKSHNARLPLMSELIQAWKDGGEVPSPKGFEKDTFYWSSEECSTQENCHKGCAMDASCPSDLEGWSDNANGHPKCVKL